MKTYRKFTINFIFTLLITINIGNLIHGFGPVWNKLQNGGSSSTSTNPSCSNQNNQLLSLLNLLCNTTQTTSITTRDACYGCFFRAGGLTNGQTQLQILSQCSTLYLIGTNYATCGAQLALVANGTTPTTAPTSTSFCYTGYCEFVRCVRRINSNMLIDTCFMENLTNRDLTNQMQRRYFYTNVTSCILAKTRCSIYNPISGQLQQQTQVNNYLYGNVYGGGGGTAVYPINYNSLQITTNGDIRLITFPSTINVADLFCSRVTTLEQSIYGSFTC